MCATSGRTAGAAYDYCFHIIDDEPDGYQVTHFETAGNEWTTTIEFSADASYAYLNDRHQIQVIELQRLKIVSEFGSSAPLRVWGPAGVISEWLGE